MSAKLWLASLAIISALPAWGKDGADSSGGGNALVCFDDASIPALIRKDGGNLSNRFIPHVVSVETYDLYAARKAYGEANLLPIEDDEELLQYVKEVSDQIKVLVPQLAWMIEDSAAAVPENQILNQPFGLVKVDDVEASSPYDSRRCVLATMATHYLDNGSYFLHFDERLFEHKSHSKLSKAVLLLHEFVYMGARRLGQTSSKNARELVGMLIRKKTGLTARQWIELARSLGFTKDGKPFYGYPGALAYRSALKMFDVATKLQVMPYALMEQTKVTVAQQALAIFGVSCAMKNAVGCVQTILKLEEAHAPGVEKLAPLKKELLDFYSKKAKDTCAELVRFYQQIAGPTFAKMPYGTEASRKEVPDLVLSSVAEKILDLIAMEGEINEMDPAKNANYESLADQAARYTDERFNLDVNPLED
jgi:hypothetical protein